MTLIKTIGQTTALIPEASTADDPSELLDGQSGDTGGVDIVGSLEGRVHRQLGAEHQPLGPVRGYRIIPVRI